MKHNFKILLIATLLITAPIFMLAQNPPLPDDTPVEGTEVGGAPAGAPIGNGTVILLTLAAAYGFRKVYVFRNTAEEAEA
jgi:hypothetical protein